MSSLLPFYNRVPVKFTKGEGAYLYDEAGEKYLDFASGIAVNSLGHCHGEVNEVLKNQAEKLWHTSNLYHIDGMEEFAEDITEKTFAEGVFFANSGAETIELAIKLIRKYSYKNKPSLANGNKPHRIITFHNAFHGRTNGAIAASGSDKMLHGFRPELSGFDNLPFGDIEAVKRAITEETAGIIIEPIQGEGGVNVADFSFLQNLRKLCDTNDIILCYDEVQCGIGRTGFLMGYNSICNINRDKERCGVCNKKMTAPKDEAPECLAVPDIVCIAKGIGNGFPLGVLLAGEKVAKAVDAGDHGSTYGGNPLAIAVGHKVFNTISNIEFLKEVHQKGLELLENMNDLAKKFPNIIKSIKGKGLMLGLEIQPNFDAKDLVAKLRENRLLTVPAAQNVIRILPPLIISEHHIKECNRKMYEVFDAVK